MPRASTRASSLGANGQFDTGRYGRGQQFGVGQQQGGSQPGGAPYDGGQYGAAPPGASGQYGTGPLYVVGQQNGAAVNGTSVPGSNLQGQGAADEFGSPPVGPPASAEQVVFGAQLQPHPEQGYGERGYGEQGFTQETYGQQAYDDHGYDDQGYAAPGRAEQVPPGLEFAGRFGNRGYSLYGEAADYPDSAAAASAEHARAAGYAAPTGQFAEAVTALPAPVPADAATGEQWSPNGSQACQSSGAYPAYGTGQPQPQPGMPGQAFADAEQPGLPAARIPGPHPTRRSSPDTRARRDSRLGAPGPEP